MNQIKKPNISKKLIFNKFKILKLIKKGVISFIYEGINTISKLPVALKFEPINNIDNDLEKECNFLLYLQGYGIPKIISYGKSGKYNVLIEELLGPDLKKISQLKNIKFSLKDICMIAIQIIQRIKYIHEKNII